MRWQVSATDCLYLTPESIHGVNRESVWIRVYQCQGRKL